MAYSRNPTWKDYPDTSTPIVASKLENIENGLVNAATTADSAASQASQAETDAQSAISKANAAQSTANSAQSAATSATNTANAAQSTALSAQNAAQSAQASAANSANLVNAPADSAIATAIKGSGTQTQAALNGRYSPLSQARLGNRWVFLGDSITAGASSYDTTNSLWGGDHVTYAMVLSGGRIQVLRNAGVPGNTAAQMLSRFDTDVTPYAPDVVFVLAGTNDCTSTFSLSAYASTMQSIIGKILAIGATPVMATIPPNDTATPSNRLSLISLINGWLRRYAAKNGIPLVDFHAVLTDPLTGHYVSGYSADGTHPQTTAKYLMGKATVDTLNAQLTPCSPIMAQDVTNTYNLVANPMFTQARGAALVPPTITVSKTAGTSSLAAGTYYYVATIRSYFGETTATNEVSITVNAGDVVTVTVPAVGGQYKHRLHRSTTSGAEVFLKEVSAGNPSLITDDGTVAPNSAIKPPTVNDSGSVPSWGVSSVGWVDLATVSGVPGNVFRLSTKGGPAAKYQQTITGWNVGDTLAFSAHVGQSADAYSVAIGLDCTGASNGYNLEYLDAGVSFTGSFYEEIVVPTGTTAITLNISAGTPSAATQTDYVEVGQVSVYNLTVMGLASSPWG